MVKSWIGREGRKRRKEQERMLKVAERIEKKNRGNDGKEEEEERRRDLGRILEYNDVEMRGTGRRSHVSHILESLCLTEASSLLTVQPTPTSLRSV